MEAVHHETSLLLAIILLPMVGSVLVGLFARHSSERTVSILSVGAVGVSFVLALIAFIRLYGLAVGDTSPVLVQQVYEWFELTVPGKGPVPINVRFAMDTLSGVMALVVTGVGGLIHLYAIGYMHEDRSYARFFSYLNLFTASMLILILASNLPLMFVGWEGVGLCSYLLIGFWYENRDYAAAGRKAFVANRIGDFGVLIAMFLIVGVAGSFEFSDINHLAAESAHFTATAAGAGFGAAFPAHPFGLSATFATVACLFLFLGCTGKSAQIPLFVWLPDAMAGPTPVSALIHAATMVTAGVYLCCRLSPLFLLSDVAMAVIAVVATVTALLAASIALVQKEMKKILAYSTVSQLGFMFAGVGVGFFSAGFFHVVTHAFFKACLFLGAGSVMHAVGAHGDADLTKVGGLRKYMPITRWTFLFACLSISGVPLTAGFFSKDELLLGAATMALHGGKTGSPAGWFTYVGLVLAATMTAFYMFRLYFLAFTGDYQSAKGAHDGGSGAGHDDHGYDPHPHESPGSMTFPLIVLGIGSLIVGYLGLPEIVPFVHTHFPIPNWWNEWLGRSVAHLPGHGAHGEVTDFLPSDMANAGGLLAMLVGIGLAWVMYRNKPLKEPEAPGGFYRLLRDKWRVDELYDATVIGPTKALSLFGGRADQTFVDGILARFTQAAVGLTGWVSSRAQTGSMPLYGMVMTVGVLGLLTWFVTPHARLTIEPSGGQTARLVAAAGPGYEYRWDFDNDGRPDTGWSRAPEQTHTYAPSAYEGYELLAIYPSFPVRGERRFKVGDTWTELPFDARFPGWRTRAGALPPTARQTARGIELRPNGADLRFAGPVEDGAATLPPRRIVTLGGVNLIALPKVRSTVEVRNAFGSVSNDTVEVTLPGPIQRRAALDPAEVQR